MKRKAVCGVFILLMVAGFLAGPAQAQLGYWDGYVDLVAVNINDETLVRVTDVETPAKFVYKIVKLSENLKTKGLAIALTAASTGNPVRLYFNYSLNQPTSNHIGMDIIQ